MSKKYNTPLVTDEDAYIAMDIADEVETQCYAARRGSQARMILMILMPVTRERLAPIGCY